MGLLLLAIVWLISPFFLIPMIVGSSAKRKKMNRFIEQLHTEKRITSIERFSLKTEAETNDKRQYNFTPVQRDNSPSFRDEARNTYGQKGVQNSAGNVGYVPKSMETPEGQDAAAIQSVPVMQDNTAAQAAVTAALQAEIQPQHHHDGVDLVKHEAAEEKKIAENAEKAVPQLAQEAPVQEKPADEKPVQETPVQKPAQQTPAEVHTVPVQQGYVPAAAAEYSSRQPQKVQRVKRPKKQYSSAAVLTGIGITFVVLAGIIFSTAFWVQMSDWTRVGVLAGQAALFFGMFGFAHKKLKIEGTAAAVYILGSVFTTIAYITTGYFGLFGAWFGIEGGGMMLFLAMGALLMTFFASGAMKVFANPICEYVSSITLAASGTLVLGQFSNYFENKFAAFSLLTSAAGLLAEIALLRAEAKGKEITKPVSLTYKLTRAAYALMAVPCLMADFSNADGIGWSVFSWGVWLIYTGNLLWRAIRERSEKTLGFHAVLVVLGAFSLYFTLKDYHVFALIITVFSVLCSWIYVYLDKKDALLFRADGVHAVLRTVFAMVGLPLLLTHPIGSYEQLMVILIWVVDFAALAAYKKQKLLLIPQCAAVISLAYELIVQLDRAAYIYAGDRLASLILLLFGIFGTMVYRYLGSKDKLRVKADVINVIMRALLSLPACMCIMDRFGRWDELCWAMCLLMIAELSGYAIMLRRQREIFFRFVFILMAVFMLIPQDFYAYELDNMKLFVMIMFGTGVVCTAAYEILHHYKKTLFDAKIFILSAKTLIGLGAFVIVYDDILGADPFSWYSWLLVSCMAAETLIYAIIRKNQLYLFVHNICLAVILFECGVLLDDERVFGLLVTALLAVLTMIYYRLHRSGKLRFSAKASIIFMRSIFGLLAVSCMARDLGDPNWESFGIGVILAMELLYYGVYGKNEGVLFAHVAALTYAFWQIGLYSCDFSVFALICCITAAGGTLVHHILKKEDKLRFDVKNLIVAVNAIYALIYVIMLVAEHPVHGAISLIIWSLVTAELIFYGIRNNNKHCMMLHSISLLVLFHAVSFMIGSHLGGGYTNTFIFAMLTAAALALYYIVPAVFTDVADVLYTLILFGIGVHLLYYAALPYGVITMAVAAVFMAIQAFSETHVHSRFMQVLLPLPEMITAMMLSGYINREYGMNCRSLCMGICAAVLCAGAFALSFGSANDRKYKLMKIIMELGSGVSLLLAYDHNVDLTASIIVIAVSVALFAVMQNSKCNIHSALPMFTLFMGAGMAARSIWWYDHETAGNAVIIFSFAMTAVLTVASKLTFPDEIYKKDDNRFVLDIAHFGILLCVISCMKDSTLFSERARVFIALLEMTVFTANFIRRSTTEKAKKAIMTIASALAGLALMERPFMQFENSTVTTKIVLLIIVLFGLAVKKIWAEDEKLSSEFSQAVFMAAFLLLIADGLMNQSLLNSLIVLSVSLVLLIYSFVRKTKRWFLVSAAALLGLTLYITGDFLAAVAWWAYLLLAGILLIAVAAVTEYLRQRAAKNPQEERFFVDWKW